MIKKTTLFLSVFLFAALVFSGCASNGNISQAQTSAGSGKLSVVTTIFPQYDFARRIGGDRVDVKMLLSPGSESHDFEPTLADITTVQNAGLFIYVGGETDKWAQDVLASAGKTDTASIALTKCVTLREEELAEGMQDDEEDSSGEGTAYDEHVWTSVKNAMLICEAICDKLCELDPEGSDYYRANLAGYLDELSAIDADISAAVSSARRNVLIFEGRFPFLYLCRDYGLDYYAALKGCSNDTEVSLSSVSFLINKVNETSAPVVFNIEFSSCTVSDTICAATGAKPLTLHSCHNVSQADFDSGITYADLMRRNADNLREALD